MTGSQGERMQHPRRQAVTEFTEYGVPSTEYRVPSTEYRVPSTEYRVPSTEYRVPSTEYVVRLRNTEYRVRLHVDAFYHPVIPSRRHAVSPSSFPAAMGTLEHGVPMFLQEAVEGRLVPKAA